MPWDNWMNSISDAVNATFNGYNDENDGNMPTTPTTITAVNEEEEFTPVLLSRRGRRKRNKKLSNGSGHSTGSLDAIQDTKPKYFSQSRLAHMTMTVDSIIYYFEEFHNKDFEKISPASSSATATFYFLLIQKITCPNTLSFCDVKAETNETDKGKESDTLVALKNSLGIHGKQLNNIIRMDTNNRIHLTKLIEAIARLLDTKEEKFSVNEPQHQQILNRLKNECYYIAKAVEHDITYAQACDPRLVYQLDLKKKQQQLQTQHYHSHYMNRYGH